MWCFEGVFHTIIIIWCKPSCPVIGIYVISILIQSAVTKRFWSRSGIYYITQYLRSHYWASFQSHPKQEFTMCISSRASLLKEGVANWAGCQGAIYYRIDRLQNVALKSFFRKSPWFSCLGVAESKRAGGVVRGV